MFLVNVVLGISKSFVNFATFVPFSLLSETTMLYFFHGKIMHNGIPLLFFDNLRTAPQDYWSNWRQSTTIPNTIQKNSCNAMSKTHFCWWPNSWWHSYVTPTCHSSIIDHSIAFLFGHKRFVRWLHHLAELTLQTAKKNCNPRYEPVVLNLFWPMIDLLKNIRWNTSL